MDANRKLKVLLVSSEATPYVKTGGLGDVAGSLPVALNTLGIDCRLVVPKYKNIKRETIKNISFLDYIEVHLAWRNQTASIYEIKDEAHVYFIENDYYFGREGLYGYADDNERFAFLCKSIIEMLPIIGFKPDIIHLNDWHTGPLALMLREVYQKMSFYKHIKTLYTIHNLQHQGVFPSESLHIMDLSDYYYHPDAVEFYGNISYMKAGLMFSDRISTVSETYAKEIQEQRYGYGMDGILRNRNNVLSGIVNGIDYEAFNPEKDSRIFKNFSQDNLSGKKINKIELQKELGLPQSDTPLIGIVTRLADQKGLDLITTIIDGLLQEPLQIVILGTGDGRYEYTFSKLSERFPDKISANIKFDDVLANKIYAGSDMFLMPSLFEPCGLGQLIAMRYGSVPIVRATGGLVDTVTEFDINTKKGNGFLFNEYSAHELFWVIKKALDIYNMGPNVWNQVVKNGMSCDFSWEKSAKDYDNLYNEIVEK